MGKTTFSGPVLAGGINETTGSTLGANVKNTGHVTMVQGKDVAVTGATANTNIAVIPANSQILFVHVDVTEVSNDTNAATFSVGTTSNATAFTAAANLKALGRTSQSAAALGLMSNVGASDIKVVGVFTGTDGDGNTGAVTTSVTYAQDNSLQRAFTIA
jgi:hypothetical protein|tara:strand:+ start:1071 stop:1547 length:477 start_codon:yes stop_codon:yes gene_type:complete